MINDILLLITNYLTDIDSEKLLIIKNHNLLKKYSCKSFYNYENMCDMKISISKIIIKYPHNNFFKQVFNKLNNFEYKLPRKRYKTNERILSGIKKVDGVIFRSYNIFDVSFFPNTLRYIDFGDNFNNSIADLPETLTQIIFGYSFNQPISKLPLNLTNLTLGHCFDQHINLSSPNLTHIIFGHSFNRRINILPSKLTHLTFGYRFDQKIKILPKSLIYLKLGFMFSHYYALKLKLPHNLKKLLVHKTYRLPIIMYDNKNILEYHHGH